MKVAFVEKRFSASSLALIETANQIIEEYEDNGLRLTLRQLYYQFVARGFIANSQREYKRIGSVVNDARLAGLISWAAIEDRTRNLVTHRAWTSPKDIVEQAARQYRLDPWPTQPFHVEVWVEKEALLSVVARACRERRVPYFACRGYTSQSEMFDAGYHRLANALEWDKDIRILHLGDHDPSGIDMTRDIEDRLALFAGAAISVDRLALNFDQVEQYQPPPNPAKTTDSRFGSYVRRFGKKSWELDALDPMRLVDLIETSIEALIDEESWNAVIADETNGRIKLEGIAENFDRAAAAVHRSGEHGDGG